METAAFKQPGTLGLAELDAQRDLSTVMLIRQALETGEPELKNALYEQACNQEVTHISEVLEGVVKTRFEFENLEGKLFALQPGGVTDWEELHQNGLARARIMADMDPDFKFYREIAEAELEEARLQKAMAEYGRPAAMVRLSLSGSDVAEPEKLKALGRDPHLDRAYLRVSVFDGKTAIDSRSLDHMSLDRAKKLYQRVFGVELPKGATSLDILKMPLIYGEGQMPVAEMHKLAEMITSHYDQMLYEETGRVHRSGRSLGKNPDTYAFVLENQDLIRAHMTGLEKIVCSLGRLEAAEIANQLRYDIMSSFKRRLEGSWVERGSLADSVTYAGNEERAGGTEFAGCDVILGTNRLAGAAGYVNAAGAEGWIWKDGKCVVKNCPSQAKRQNVKVGPCSVCRDCQTIFDKGIDPASVYRPDKAAGSASTIDLALRSFLAYWEELKAGDRQKLKNLSKPGAK